MISLKVKKTIKQYDEKIIESKRLSGILSSNGEHLSLHDFEEENVGHAELLKQKTNIVGMANAIENHGYSRLHYSYGILYIETTVEQLPKVRNWINNNVDPKQVEEAQYTLYPHNKQIMDRLFYN